MPFVVLVRANLLCAVRVLFPSSLGTALARTGTNTGRQVRLPVEMGGMGLTSAVDIREPAWIGTWALVAGPMRQLHAPSATST